MDIIDFVVIGILLWAAFRLGQASILSILKEEIRNRIINGEISVDAESRAILNVPATNECHFDVERHDGHYYAYAQDGEFLAQGSDFRSMFQTIKQRFPGRNFRINKLQTELTEEEQTRMVTAIMETFGAQHEKTN
jgi:hypothetical protein